MNATPVGVQPRQLLPRGIIGVFPQENLPTSAHEEKRAQAHATLREMPEPLRRTALGEPEERTVAVHAPEMAGTAIRAAVLARSSRPSSNDIQQRIYPATRIDARVAEVKTISDVVHGSVRLGPLMLGLLETLELQRLNSIRQLGLTYLVFPGANHSRIEHCLGVGHVAGRLAGSLGLPEAEQNLVVAAGLLHDVGHGPFSHTLEHVLSTELSLDHMHLTQRIITGEDDNVATEERKAFPAVLRIPEVLEANGLRPQLVAALIRGPPPGRLRFGSRPGAPAIATYLSEIIHSAIDADQIDYLMRDAHYTAVPQGRIDFDRLVQTVAVHRGHLAWDRKGLPALEGFLVARSLMYSAVYFHKTVRIAEQMVARAVERSGASMEGIQKMVDAELLSWLMERGGFARDTALRIKYRRLYKRAWAVGPDDLSEDDREALMVLRDPDRRRRAEDSIAKRVGAKAGEVIVDLPRPELLLSEPRIANVDVRVIDEEGTATQFSRVSSLSRALQTRDVSDWVVMAACPPEHRAAVARAAPKVLLAT